MSKSITIVKDIVAKCDVCGHLIMVDDMGHGECDVCGWVQMSYCLKHKDEVALPNFVPYNRARQLVKEGKRIYPTFSELLIAFWQYGELQFFYKGRHYGMIRHRGGVDFYEWNVMQGLQLYATVDEFAEKANINGVLLKNIWNDTEKVGEM